MSNLSKNQPPQPTLDKPKVRFTSLGAPYVDPQELARSKIFKQRLEALRSARDKMGRKAASTR